MIWKRILLILFLAAMIIPFNLFDNRWLAAINVFFVIAVAYLINKIITTKMLHRRTFSELIKSKRELLKGGFVYDATVSFGNLLEYSYHRFNAREFANFQLKEKGVLVRTWESISFGILYKDITQIEIIEIGDAVPSARYNCYLRIHAKYEVLEIFFFRISIDEDFVKWLLPFYHGEIIHRTYEEFREKAISERERARQVV